MNLSWFESQDFELNPPTTRADQFLIKPPPQQACRHCDSQHPQVLLLQLQHIFNLVTFAGTVGGTGLKGFSLPPSASNQHEWAQHGLWHRSPGQPVHCSGLICPILEHRMTENNAGSDSNPNQWPDCLGCGGLDDCDLAKPRVVKNRLRKWAECIVLSEDSVMALLNAK
ncbi:hypothetical protein Nepgr_021369 [Nepenthes gracilis]|uniref:Uncharacterized protein n=1 Tax=Nepenthes gracilis TaxID=150966 RepID=A0AAD3XW16_NEPGR|nr:hypothetical protein Nepgr_021369 [Nepenthes gracilis]